MRDASQQARQLIENGGFRFDWVADLMYDGDRRLANVPIANPDLAWDGSAFVVGSGSCRIIWADDFGSTMIPQQIGDWFSPFGAELQVDGVISSGKFSERIPMGRFVITAIPDAKESEMLFRGSRIHPGESFGVELKDGLCRVQRDPFGLPTASRSTSVWGEIQNVTDLPIIRNLDDASIVAKVTHDEDRAEALSKLFDRLGAWPMLNSSGTLIGRPKAWPAVVGEITGKVSAPRVMTSERTYNRVVVEGKSPGGDPVYGIAEIPEGYLRTKNADGSRSPFGRATMTYRSELLTTTAQCQAYAAELLGRVSKLRGVVREVTERLNPLREVGDVLLLEGKPVRALKVQHSGGGEDGVTRMSVEVPDE